MSAKQEWPYLHGGRPWDYWKREGRFFYVVWEMHDDGDFMHLAPCTRVKIGITEDPKARLAYHRRHLWAHATYGEIIWMESSAKILEQSLKEIFTIAGFKVPFTTEVFDLPHQTLGWLLHGCYDKWHDIQRHDRMWGGASVRSILDCLLPRYYPSRWLRKALKRNNIMNWGENCMKFKDGEDHPEVIKLRNLKAI